MPQPSSDGVQGMRARREANRRAAPAPRHPRTDSGTGAGEGQAPPVPAPAAPALRAAPEPAPATPPEHPETRPDSAAAAPEHAPATQPPPEPGTGTHRESQAAKDAANAALSWAAACRKLNTRTAALHTAVEAARASGVPEQVVAAALADAEQRSGGHTCPVQART